MSSPAIDIDVLEHEPRVEPCEFCGSGAVERDDNGDLLGCDDCGFDADDASV